jgi:site-specific DNA-adenine methylase
MIDPYRKQKIEPLINKPPLVRKGGKRYLASKITGMINQYDYSMYIEPFFGGGRIYFEKEPHWCEIINDIEARVMNFFYCCHKFPEDMILAQNSIVKDQNYYHYLYEKYHDSKKMSKIKNQIKNCRMILEDFPDNENKLENMSILVNHAIDYYFFANMSWRGSNSRTMIYFENDPPKETNRMRWRVFRPIGWLAERMRRTQVLNMDFTKIFELGLNYKNHNRIWYLDPPYFQTDSYEEPFEWEKYVKLNECLKKLPKTDYFILSLNDMEEYKEVFDWCDFERVKTRYTYGSKQDKKDNSGFKEDEFLITPPWKPKLQTKQKLDQFMR